MINPYETSGTSPTSPFETLLDHKSAGELLGLHPKTIQRFARLGTIPGIRIGRYWRFRASALDHWVNVQSKKHRPCITEGIQ
jgi:excisionase family DNA binding protein